MKLRFLAILTLTALTTQFSGIVNAQQQKLTAQVSVKRDGNSQPQASSLASGMMFETARDAEADISVAPVGKIKVFPSAKVLPTFDAKSLSVIVREGCASLFIEKGFSGSLIRPDGRVQKIEVGNAAEVNSCDRTPSGIAGSADSRSAPDSVGGSGISASTLAAIVIAGGAVGTFLWAVVFDDQSTVSPSR